MANRTHQKALQCTCRNTGRCGYCPSIAIRATSEALLPAGSPGRVAAERLAQKYNKSK
jgi:hypothetical protein